jgi:hypothetical protein
MCHDDHAHTLTSPVVTTHQYNVYADAQNRVASSTSATRANGDFDPALANGGLCLSCHRLPIDATASTPSPDGSVLYLAGETGVRTMDISGY